MRLRLLTMRSASATTSASSSPLALANSRQSFTSPVNATSANRARCRPSNSSARCESYSSISVSPSSHVNSPRWNVLRRTLNFLTMFKLACARSVVRSSPCALLSRNGARFPRACSANRCSTSSAPMCNSANRASIAAAILAFTSRRDAVTSTFPVYPARLAASLPFQHIR